MMKHTTTAWQFNCQGDALSLDTKKLEMPTAGQILVANHAIGINPVDWKFIETNPINWQSGHTPGVDGTGVVLSVGKGVDEHLIGKTVAYHHNLSEQGSFALHTLVYAERVMQVPQDLSAHLAAALPCPMLTAWQAFSKIPKLKGARVLITGMGAVNKLLAQMLSHAEFEVHVLSNSLTQAQADKFGVAKVFRDAPSSGHYFALFDANGVESAKALVPLLQANGHVVSILGRIDTLIDAPFTRTISYHEIALGALHSYGDNEQWLRLINEGEQLLKQVASGHLIVEQPTEFAFTALNDALSFSKKYRKKAVVVCQ